MGEHTAISWCDHTWNPVVGCTKVSPACDGCYAEYLMDERFGRVKWGKPGQKGTLAKTSARTWYDPIRWQRKAEAIGTRPFVFCASLADIFDNQWDPAWRAEAFDVMRRTPRLVYLLLTKRPQNIVDLSREAGGLPPNAAIGTTVEDQKRADQNVPTLLAAQDALKPLFSFVSCEPLIGPISFKGTSPDGRRQWDWLAGMSATMHSDGPDFDYGPALGWVITGGETDQGAHRARPTHPDWFRSLRNQAAAAGIPFHHKQNGEWIGGDQIPEDETIPSGISNDCGIAGADDNRRVWRVGRHRSGRFLDGVLHDARPEGTA